MCCRCFNFDDNARQIYCGSPRSPAECLYGMQSCIVAVLQQENELATGKRVLTLHTLMTLDVEA